MTLETQVLTVTYMGAGGFFMGVVFDLFRVVSGKFHFRRWVISACDLLFWVAATGLIFGLLLKANHGEVRVPVFLALAMGAITYYLLFSPTFIRLWTVGIDVGLKVFWALWNVVHTLVFLPLLFIGRLIWKWIFFLMKLATLFYKIVLKLIYPRSNMTRTSPTRRFLFRVSGGIKHFLVRMKRLLLGGRKK